MAVVPLTDSSSCLAFFQESVLAATRYWRDHPAVRGLQIQILDREHGQIIRAISFALDLTKAWDSARELIVTLTPYMERRGYWASWQRILQRANDVAQTRNDPAGAVTLSLLLARLLQRRSEFKAATVQYRRTMQLARRVGDEYTRARACSNLGFLYAELGFWWRAEIVCCHALAVFEQLESNHGRAHTENHLGVLYIWQRRWDLAQQHLERACEIWEAMGDQPGLLLGLVNLGSLYDDMERPDQALPHLEKALLLAQATGEEVQLANVYLNIGFAYRLQGEWDQAETYLWQAEAIYRRFSNSIGAAQVKVNLGLLYLAQKRWPEAKSYLEQALQAWDDLGNIYKKITTLIDLVEYELVRGHPQQAAGQLAEVERLMTLAHQDRHAPHWESLLAKSRRSLKDYLAHQISARFGSGTAQPN